MRRLKIFVKKVEEALAYINGNDASLYEQILLQFAAIEAENLSEFEENLKKREIIGPLLYEVFQKCGKPVELSSNIYPFPTCAHILSKDKEIRVSGKYERIDADCFFFCEPVESIIFENGVQYITELACQNLPNLKRVHLPKTLKFLGDRCFANCPNLEQVLFESEDTHIKPTAFENTKWFAQFHEDFVVLNNQLLKYNGRSKEMVIPEGVIRVNFQALKENDVIEKIVFPSSLKIVDVASFSECYNLKEIVFQGDQLEYIHPLAFYACKNLKEVVLPKSVKEIGCEAFSKYTTLVCHEENVKLAEHIVKNYPRYRIIPRS